jgi:hypothetical protein
MLIVERNAQGDQRTVFLAAMKNQQSAIRAVLLW